MSFFSSLLGLFSKLTKSLPDFLFPKTQRVVELEKLSPEKLLATLPESHLEGGEIIALFDYANPVVKEMIWEMKYRGNRTLAKNFGAVLYDTVISELADRNVFEKFGTILLMPMPISDKRRFERGWNQAELLTDAMKALDLGEQFKYLPRQLVKIRHTESQTTTATRKERFSNLKDSMRVQNPLAVENHFVVLVDDVITTGATFTEAKRTLKEAGAKRILCISVAH